MDFVSPWVAAGRPLYDNSAGNAAITAAAYPLLNRNTNALRVVAYGAADPSVLVWNGSGLTRGPHQLAGVADTRNTSLIDNAIYPTDRDARVGGRLNRLYGKLLRGAIEQRIARDFFVELGFNYESVSELLGGPFDNAESLNIFADPNRYLPGGTAAARQTALNPNAGRLCIESYPNGSEVRDLTKEVRLTTSSEFDFSRHFRNAARHLGRHRVAGLVSWRVDENRSQATRAMILGTPSFATGDLLNNSRLLRSRYYLDPASGVFTARALPGGSGDGGWFGPWTFTDTGRKGLNVGGGVRWLDQPNTGFQQRPFPDGSTGGDVTRPIPGYDQTSVDLLIGYGGRTKFFGGRPIGWRLQLNVRNLLDADDIEPLRSS